MQEDGIREEEGEEQGDASRGDENVVAVVVQHHILLQCSKELCACVSTCIINYNCEHYLCICACMYVLKLLQLLFVYI